MLIGIVLFWRSLQSSGTTSVGQKAEMETRSSGAVKGDDAAALRAMQRMLSGEMPKLTPGGNRRVCGVKAAQRHELYRGVEFEP